MVSYDEWNKAIIEYFVAGLPSGATVYLSVDDDTLIDIGNRLEQPIYGSDIDWVKDFIKATRSRCVIGNSIYLKQIYDYQHDTLPCCVAFLGAMVLAAHNMTEEDTEDENIADINYFTRLRQVFGLVEEKGGRPDGLRPAGVEEKLWQMWNWWLLRNGWIPSADPGQSIQYKYINYPLSQALLRKGDKERLEHIFRREEKASKLGRNWDRDMLGTWLRGCGLQFSSKHIKDLIQETDPRRYQATVDAIHEVYISVNWEQEVPRTWHTGSATTQRRLTSGLYRYEDPIMRTIDYHLYPQQPKLWKGENLQVIRDTQPYPLKEERPGWFLPLPWSEKPCCDISYEVRGDTRIKEIVLPERGFWILICDPYNEESGIFASWGCPGLHENFLLLCSKEYVEQMEMLRQEDLLTWDRKLPLSNMDDEWVEYHECMVLSPSWEGIIPQHQDLYDALKPTIPATISLRGGLRVPYQQAWLEGYGPEVIIYAFDGIADLKVLDISYNISLSEGSIVNKIVDTNQIISFPVLKPGTYLVQAYIAGKLAVQRRIQILSWDTLGCSQPKQPFCIKLGTFSLRGAIIEV